MKPTRIVSLAAALSLLAACGGGGGSSNNPMPRPQGDQFMAAVQSVVTSSPDDTEPQSIDAMVVTTVDDQEPMPIG